MFAKVKQTQSISFINTPATLQKHVAHPPGVQEVIGLILGLDYVIQVKALKVVTTAGMSNA